MLGTLRDGFGDSEVIQHLKSCFSYFFLLDNAYLRVYLFGSLPFAYELRKGKHKTFILIVRVLNEIDNIIIMPNNYVNNKSMPDI